MISMQEAPKDVPEITMIKMQMHKSTSMPSASPSTAPNRRLIPRSVAAASELPPARPADMGIRLSSEMEMPPGSEYRSNISCAAS